MESSLSELNANQRTKNWHPLTILFLASTFIMSLATKVDGTPTSIPYFYFGILLNAFAIHAHVLSAQKIHLYFTNFLATLAFVIFVYPNAFILFSDNVDSRLLKDIAYAFYFLFVYVLWSSLSLRYKYVYVATIQFTIYLALLACIFGFALHFYGSINFLGIDFIKQSWLSGRMHSFFPTSTQCGSIIAISILTLIFGHEELEIKWVKYGYIAYWSCFYW